MMNTINIRIINSQDPGDLSEKVNNFILEKDPEILDIVYRTCPTCSSRSVDYSVMIKYKEKVQ